MMQNASEHIARQVFDSAHLQQFLDLTQVLRTPELVLQPAIGSAPTQWILSHVPDAVGKFKLPTTKLDRSTLTAECASGNDVLHGYLCVMAWGGQRGGKGKGNSGRAWQERDQVRKNLTSLRVIATAPDARQRRAEAYELFTGSGEVSGLAPAYFTKLLTFFAPNMSCYIMDQFSALSINLLCGAELVDIYSYRSKPRGTSTYTVTRKNTGAEYETFCARIDQLTEIVNRDARQTTKVTGSFVESLLFGKKQPWREYMDRFMRVS